jgi:hypothetical protein
LNFEFGNVFVAGVEKIFLSQVANIRADFAGDFQMVVDDEADVGAFGHGQDFFGHAANFIRRRIFGAELDQIAATFAEFLRDKFWRAAMQISRVHEGVKLAVRERFHRNEFNRELPERHETKTAVENFHRRFARKHFHFAPTK